MLMSPARKASSGKAGRKRYEAPERSQVIWLRDLLHSINRGDLSARQLDIFRSNSEAGQADDLRLFWAGDIKLLSRPCVSIVGTREASDDGRSRAKRLARELVERKVVIVSGLARGGSTLRHNRAP
jgi:DNA processing protein